MLESTLKEAYDRILPLFPAGTRVSIDVDPAGISYGAYDTDEVKFSETWCICARTPDGESHFEFNCSLEDIECDAQRLLRTIRAAQRKAERTVKTRPLGRVA